MTTPAAVVNKVCLSGLNAIYQADLMIGAGDAEVVVAGGMESMTSAPHLLLGARQGYRLGDAVLHDAMMYDGLEDAHDHQTMGVDTERYMPDFPAISRERQDAFAAASHERAARATKDGILAAEITPVRSLSARATPSSSRPTRGCGRDHAGVAGGLRPAFSRDGSITAGNASQISDGGSAVVVMSEEAAERHGVQPLGRVVSYGMVAGPDTCLMTQPSRSSVKALERASLSVADVDVFEFNEAFVAVALASIDELALPLDIVNPNGGAIALGHPIGASATASPSRCCTSCVAAVEGWRGRPVRRGWSGRRPGGSLRLTPADRP